MRFHDRTNAGRLLGRRVARLCGTDAVVLGLPCGGVPVAYEVAAALHVPLDVVVVRKVGVPRHPELAMGAVGEAGMSVDNVSVVRAAGVSEFGMNVARARARAELAESARRLRAGRPAVDLTGRTAVVVDDGIATGATARVACRVAYARGAARVVLAVPVAPPDVVRALRRVVDDVVCLIEPVEFGAVGAFYEDFTQVGEEEAAALLERGDAPGGTGAVRPYVAVGVDGSASGDHAARYAADWAVRTGAELHLVHAYLDPLGSRATVDPFLTRVPSPPDGAEQFLCRLAGELSTAHPGLVVTTRLVPDSVIDALVAESRWAAVTVVGHREHRFPDEPAAVAVQADGPVLIVRPHPVGPRAPVVVGVDGSHGGEAALEFAFAAAAGTGRPLVALHAWWAHPMDPLRHGGTYDARAAEAAGGRLLTEAVEPWRAKCPDVTVSEKLVHSMNSAAELADLSGVAALVVVGSRGRGGFAELLLGSVARALVRTARSTVAVVHGAGT